MPDWTLFPLLFLAGCVAGALNVVAGGGSFLTLPVLIFAGLPPSVANGTNRVAILMQNLGAVWGFHRHRVLEWRYLLGAAVPATLGAALGAWAALEVSEDAFRKILASLMILISLWTLLKPLRAGREDSNARQVSPALLAIAFFLVGAYGGFVQAGVGFFLLAATTLAGLDLVRGNAVKVLVVLLFTVVSLGVFAWNGRVDWALGSIMGLGSLLGGQIGVRLTAVKGNTWLRRFVTVTVIVFALRLWLA